MVHAYGASKGNQPLPDRMILLIWFLLSFFFIDGCTYICSSGRNLADHKQAVHFKTNKLKCDQCDYSTFRKACLANHILYVHRKVKNFSCDLCEKKFAYRRERKKHMESKHGVMVTNWE